MAFDVKVVRKEQLKTSTWSGGTTTQLYIYPLNAVYSERNFKWRISSAKVEAEESTFTSLPGVSRIIMMIDGEIDLKHEGHHEVHLKPFEQDSFLGDWDTKSFGKVTDFNLMMRENTKGRLEVITLNQEEELNIDITGEDTSFEKIFNLFYCAKGESSFSVKDNEIIILNEGDFLMIEGNTSEASLKLNIYNDSDKETKIIKTTVLC